MTTTPPPPTTLQTKLNVLFFLAITTIAITSLLVVYRLTCQMTDLHRSPKGVLTVNAYVVRAGTLFSGDTKTLALNQADLLNDRWRLGPADALARDVVKDNVLWDQLGPAIRPTLNGLQLDDNDRLLARTHESLPARLEMTLIPELQARVASLVQCYTGDVSQCDALPPHTRTREARFSTPGAPRSAMAALLVLDEESGRIIAMTGAIARCLQISLQAKVDSKGPRATTVFAHDTDNCAQFPDARHAYLTAAAQALHPTLWLLPPGSTAKLIAAVACGRAHQLQDVTTLLAKFATSSDNRFFQRLALQCSSQYRSVFAAYAQPVPLVYDERGQPVSNLSLTPSVVPREAPSPGLGLEEFFMLKQRWERDHHGTENAIGPRKTRDYLATQAFVSTAIGNGGHFTTLVSLARLMRAIGLAAGGHTSAPAVHVVRGSDADSLPTENLSWVANPDESKLILKILGGVTAKSFGGTAAEACHLVVGDCPRDGLADFSGKTGTSDFASSDGLHVEEGEQFPSKHMVARFMAGGRWYITAAAAFRTRDRLGRHLENANAAAELVLLARSAIAGMQLAASPTALE